jgi:catechol 2,3-dioxygenase-like lactoylglutathione lyase family enzyme
MPVRLFDHIDLRVHDLQKADSFYGQFLPEIGFPVRIVESATVISFEARSESEKPEFIALDEEPGYQPSSTRIAFWADHKSEVDRLGPILQQAGARNIEGPMACPEYSPTYYAVFFEDPSGNRLEVCCRTAG